MEKNYKVRYLCPGKNFLVSKKKSMQEGKQFLTAKAQESGVHKLPSGMLFQVLKKGHGAKSPGPKDECDVHYRGTFMNGKEFDSSYGGDPPATWW